jgi:hypothetical protein
MKVNREVFFEMAFEKDVMYKIDMLLDWDSKRVALYVDNDFKKIAEFYSKDRDKKMGCLNANSVNTLSLYNLSPGTTSLFRDIRVCKDLCPELVFSTVPTKDNIPTPDSN